MFLNRCNRHLVYLKDFLVKNFILYWLLLFGFFQIHPLEAESEIRSLEESLVRAGENRSELEDAISAVDGWEAEYLVRRASQYDLVNLTSELLVENILYARKVRSAPYLNGEMEESIWRDWVLPYRILEEDLSLWRKTFYDKLVNQVAECQTTQEAVGLVLDWMWKVDADGNKRVKKQRSGDQDFRNQSPIQAFSTQNAGCCTKNSLCIYLLRSVGIPTRHCSIGFWYSRNGIHYYGEYWDAQKGEWMPWDFSDDKGNNGQPLDVRIKQQSWATIAAYAHPAYHLGTDVYGTGSWTLGHLVTEAFMDTRLIRFEAKQKLGSQVNASLWNYGAWQVAARGRGSEQQELELGENQWAKRPILFSSTDGSSLHWAFGTIGSQDQTISLSEAQDGRSLIWLASMAQEQRKETR